MGRVNVLDGLGLDSTVRRMQRQLVLTYETSYERGLDIPNPWVGAITLLTRTMAVESWNGERWQLLAGGNIGRGIVAIATTAPFDSDAGPNGGAAITAGQRTFADFGTVPLFAGRYYRVAWNVTNVMRTDGTSARTRIAFPFSFVGSTYSPPELAGAHSTFWLDAPHQNSGIASSGSFSHVFSPPVDSDAYRITIEVFVGAGTVQLTAGDWATIEDIGGL